MKPLDKEACATLAIITSGLLAPGDAKNIDNTNGVYMAVNVDLINNIPNTGTGNLFAVSHSFIQNGDVMMDPEMTFWEAEDMEGNVVYYPCSFRTDGIGMEMESVIFENDEFKGYRKDMQSDQAEFAEMWMLNIKEQQNL